MIYIIKSNQPDLNEIVSSAFERSCGQNSIHQIDDKEFLEKFISNCNPKSFDIFVFLNPSEPCSKHMTHLMNHSESKVIIFGSLTKTLANYLQVNLSEVSQELRIASECEPAKTHFTSESKATIQFEKNTSKQFTQLPSRNFCRYDFTNEWNNLGYGAIKTDISIWAICHQALIKEENTLASVYVDSRKISGYIGLWDHKSSSTLWVNRSVGPIDSYEWRLVEEFICNHRCETLPCWPVISEIPFGYDAAVTMRLDCDEDVESARILYQEYKEMQIPFSLALHAKVLDDFVHHQLPKEVDQTGGAILSHTLTHAPHWGGSKETAKFEGLESANIIQEAIGKRPKYAVSPFHHTPAYAREGLEDAGYSGCVGGIISSDPDFLMARAGRPPFGKVGFIGHSQQCMLHGDCLTESTDPIHILKKAFEQSLKGKYMFGYLDHPFSNRYQYGWVDEIQRLNIHRDFVCFMKNSDKKILFLNQNDALDFLLLKSQVHILESKENLKLKVFDKHSLNLSISIEYKNEMIPIKSGVFIS